MDRREFLTAAGLASLAAMIGNGRLVLAEEAGAQDETPFSWDILKEKAKSLAAEPFKPSPEMDPALLALNYDQFRNISFDPAKEIWRDVSPEFHLELFHAGYIYRDPIEIFLVDKGKASKLRYDRSMFHFGPAEKRVPLPDNAGFSGLRIHGPVNEPGVFEEFLVLQGASYFRGKAKGQTYGLSARGLAIDTVQPSGEEFPVFRAYWAETPAPDAKSVTVYALLNSRSIAGAYRFVISRSVDVVMEIECELYPRRALDHVGIAPFSSMFFFGPADHTFHDDFRPRVHDSDGLLLHTGEGEWIWRPLVTAPSILYSMFSDRSPKGFGLIQRQRDFEHYQDINASYERRPGAWVEPLSDWGYGSVDLIELPTGTEYTDNIVAFWRPREPLQANQAYNYRYRLNWCWHMPEKRNIAEVIMTRTGRGLAEGSRYIVIDFAGGELYSDADIEHWDYEVNASAGRIAVYTVGPNPFIDGKRVALEYHPDGERIADLSFQIRRFGKALTEKWVYRWAN
jgi:glucans biosynthesis protein